MTSMAAAREVVARQFTNVRDVDAQVIRGEKMHDERCYAVAYIDLADDIVERAQHLREFQERVIGDDFFESPEQLRWNNYLYLVAGPNSVGSAGYQDAKIHIEADKEYARKRVVSEEELVQLLNDSKLFDSEQAASSEDVVGVWTTKLAAGGLDILLDKPTPRTEVVERIGKRTAGRPTSPKKIKPLNASDQDLTLAHLKSLEITRFRPVHDGQTYSFGAVTLIVGPNGSGKTSLLEAIEYLYCGHNRRPAMTGHIVVKGVVSPLDTGRSFEMAATTDTARIKARCLAWYGRKEHQAKAIIDGFSRYNFLDTDAAFRLSTGIEPGEISKDLSRLLIGTEAATLWEYLEKVSTDLDSAWKRASEQISLETERANLLEAEVFQLKASPSQAKSLSKTYRAALESMGWLRATSGADNVVVDHERRPLEELAGLLSELVAFPMPSAETKEEIRARVKEIERVLEIVQPLESTRIRIQDQVAAAISRGVKFDSEIDHLTNWLSFCTAEFPKALLTRQLARQAAESLRQRLGRFVGATVPTIDEDLTRATLADAESAAQRVVTNSTSSITMLEATENSYGALESAHAQASQQLKDAAKALVQEGHSVRACPVCGTDHSPEDLLAKIDGITSMAISSEPLRLLQQNLQSARTELAAAQQRLAAISTMRQISIQLGIDVAQPIGEIAKHFQRAKTDLERADAELLASRAHLNTLEKNGLTEKAFNALRAEVKTFFTDDVDIEQVDVVTALRDKRSSARKSIEGELISLRAELEAIGQKIYSAAQAVEPPKLQANVKQDQSYQALLDMLSQARSADALATKVAARIKLPENLKFADIRPSLAGAIEAFDVALYAVSTEASASDTLNAKDATLSQSKARIDSLRGIVENQRSALDVLEGLVRDSSLEDATQSALDAIRLQINDVFGRIHSPSEYEYASGNEHLLQTRDGHTSRTLEEVSTGQRAAFALSIFLALNLTAKSAPQLMLIDDPIAHIDDLNALSFLDYLRDLAVHSRRQIFFATADSRIAALFEKKFAFLGTAAFQKIELTRRPEV